MTSIALWLLVYVHNDFHPVIERFPTREACEQFRASFMQQRADWWSTGKPLNQHFVRCHPATVARP